MSDETMKLHEAFDIYVRLSTLPVAVKLAKKGQQIGQEAKYPLKDIGNRLSVCQGMTLVRTLGWTIVFRKEDHACPLARIILGHTKPDSFLRGTIAEPYQDQEACAQIMEQSYPRWPVDSIHEIWMSPLNKCRFRPDNVIVYGSPAQILYLIQAANFREGKGIQSSSTGRLGCATWMAGVIQSDECTYMIPGPGERVFAGTQDHEMSFAMPPSKFQNLIEGLEYIRKRRAFRFPVPNMAIMSEPKIPKEYYAVDPECEIG
jgi:uncharacterized protein (DUF169 family)